MKKGHPASGSIRGRSGARDEKGQKKMKKKDTVVEQVYAILKEQIVTLQLRPGQLLMVQQLAQELGFSRTPVREALVRLMDEFLVAEADGNKFRVSEISWKWIQDIYQARMILEEAAIDHAAREATPEQVAELEQILDRMEQAHTAMDYAAYFDADCIFHKTIVAICGNSILNNWVEKTSDHQQRIRYCTMGLSSEMTKSLAEHREMVRCIREKDPAMACQISRHHLDRALCEMMKLKSGVCMGSLSMIIEGQK